jgi:hypothetical protein
VKFLLSYMNRSQQQFELQATSSCSQSHDCTGLQGAGEVLCYCELPVVITRIKTNNSFNFTPPAAATIHKTILRLKVQVRSGPVLTSGKHL